MADLKEMRELEITKVERKKKNNLKTDGVAHDLKKAKAGKKKCNTRL